MNAATTTAIATYEKSLKELERTFVRLEASLQAARSKQAQAQTDLGTAANYLAVKDEVKSALEALNAQAHKKVTDTFEKLLTAICRDVLGDYARDVKFSVEISNNVPALDIYLENQGKEESILEGNGGALTNAICAGLRLGILTRLRSMRKFIVFDEPDCWVKPDLITAFVTTLTRACESLGAQALFISHHDYSHFPESVAVTRISPDGVEEVRAGKTYSSDAQPGFRRLKLTDFRAHRSLDLELGPGVTAIIGPNNFGKSAIPAAFRALCMGVSADTDINHEATTFKIETWLENGHYIKLARNLKKSPKLLWTVQEAGKEPVDFTAESRNQAPERVVAMTGVFTVEDIDPQLHRQKIPVFLLDDAPSKKAKILSLGRESSLVGKALELQNRQVADMREIQSKAERRLEKTRTCLDLPYKGWADLCLEDIRDAIDAAQEKLNWLKQSRASQATAEKLVARLKAIQSVKGLAIPSVPKAPSDEKLRGLVGLKDLVFKLRSLQPVRTLKKPELVDKKLLKSGEKAQQVSDLKSRLLGLQEVKALVPTFTKLSKTFDGGLSTAKALQPKLTSLDSVQAVTKSLARLQGVKATRSELAATLKSLESAVSLAKTSNLAGVEKSKDSVKRLSEYKTRLVVAEKKLSTEQATQKDLELDFELLKAEGGGVCPLCNAPFGEHGEHKHAA